MQYQRSVCRRWMCQALVTPGYMSEWLHCPKCSNSESVSRRISRKKPRSSACVTSSFSSTPSMAASGMVGAVLPDPVIDLVVRLDRLPGVAPKAFDHVVLHRALGQIP